MPDSLGTYTQNDKTFLFFHLDRDPADFFRVHTTRDGFIFEDYTTQARVKDNKGKPENIIQCRDFRISRTREEYWLTYRYLQKGKAEIRSASSHNLVAWKKRGWVSGAATSGVILPDPFQSDVCWFVGGGKDLRVARSADLKDWEWLKKPLLDLPFAGCRAEVGMILPTAAGLALVYAITVTQAGKERHLLEVLLLDPQKGLKPLWVSGRTVWQQTGEWAGEEILFVGTAVLGGELVSYWQSKGDKLYAVSHPFFREILEEPEPKRIFFHPVARKFAKNPIITPRPQNAWESKFVFNPAAVYLGGKVHLVYRAVGDKDISVLGYASSRDGFRVDQRPDKPVYVPREPFESNPEAPFSKIKYLSGWGCGGCEDPRLTELDGKLYMTYTAFNGRELPRVALTWIDRDDFVNHDWKWAPAVLISPPGQINKNWVLFPEKIAGKYALVHSLNHQEASIEYLDNLDFDNETFLKSHYRRCQQDGCWDSVVRGAGPPPIKTADGWLLLYHANDANEPGKYKMGAMLLDTADPTRVICRSGTPLVEPTEQYENTGFKPGIVYTCGAVVKNGDLIVYYGGADNVICAAHAPLAEFVHSLKTAGSCRLEPISGKISERPERENRTNMTDKTYT